MHVLRAMYILVHTTDSKMHATISLLLLISFLQCQGRDAAAEYKTVRLTTGEVKGVHMVTATGNEGVAFKGVPYVEPPVGPLRFRRPVQKKSWTGVLDATQWPVMCPQSGLQLPGLGGGDDDEVWPHFAFVLFFDCFMLYLDNFVWSTAIRYD